MKITVQSKSGQLEYECGQEENLLYAGLRQGLTLPYECATGTCGTCRARVMDGQAEILWPDAPGLSYVKQEKNEVLMCRARALGDCTLRVPSKVERANGEIAPNYRRGTIGNVDMLTHDVAAFDVAIGAPISFLAGQFVVLETPEVKGGRAYSMVNYRRETNSLAFVVKRKPDGKFSDWLFNGGARDKKINVYGPLGRATFQPEDGKNLLCIAGGSGVAGMMSIIAKGCEERYFADHKAYLFFGVRTAQDVFFMEELSGFVSRFPGNLEVTVALSDENVPGDLKARHPNLDFASGFVHAVTSERMAGRYADVVAFVAGPPPMVDGTLRMLVLEARLPGTDIRYDKFT